ncbi:hypothetical protein AVEN_966-1 [Araneus ventricosus]|uniref:Uncharacterized protein n=1 Tax=Araneus ventricosus TaxID=182803 RepID=A0A4Y2CYF2_ARAVE|nr:hypothetical protein AVEN_966-1 [Araneus ventricosus]
MLFARCVSLMAGKRVLQRFFTDGQANKPRQWQPFWRQNEGSRTRDIMVLSLLETEPSSEFYMTTHPVRKGITTKLLERGISLFGVFTAVQADKLIYAERY